jgi:hypothetical protein
VIANRPPPTPRGEGDGVVEALKRGAMSGGAGGG